MNRVLFIIVALLMSHGVGARNCPSPQDVIGDWVFQSIPVQDGATGSDTGYIKLQADGRARLKGVTGFAGFVEAFSISGRWAINNNTCMLVISRLMGIAGQTVVFRGAVAGDIILLQGDAGFPVDLTAPSQMIRTPFSPFN